MCTAHDRGTYRGELIIEGSAAELRADPSLAAATANVLLREALRRIRTG